MEHLAQFTWWKMLIRTKTSKSSQISGLIFAHIWKKIGMLLTIFGNKNWQITNAPIRNKRFIDSQESQHNNLFLKIIRKLLWNKYRLRNDLLLQISVTWLVLTSLSYYDAHMTRITHVRQIDLRFSTLYSLNYVYLCMSHDYGKSLNKAARTKTSRPVRF